MTLTFSIFLAFLLYVDQSRRLALAESKLHDSAALDDATSPVPTVGAGRR
jgi:hypothetical protein